MKNWLPMLLGFGMIGVLLVFIMKMMNTKNEPIIIQGSNNSENSSFSWEQGLFDIANTGLEIWGQKQKSNY